MSQIGMIKTVITTELFQRYGKEDLNLVRDSIDLAYAIGKEERDALVAQIEVLRKAYEKLCFAIQAVDDCEDGSAEMGDAFDNLFSVMRDNCHQMPATPVECLLKVKAESGRAGFVEGVEDRQRIENALQTTFTMAPQGMTKEQKRAFMSGKSQ